MEETAWQVWTKVCRNSPRLWFVLLRICDLVLLGHHEPRTDSKTRNLEPSLGHPGSAESQVTMGMKTDADEDKLCDRVSAARALGKTALHTQ